MSNLACSFLFLFSAGSEIPVPTPTESVVVGGSSELTDTAVPWQADTSVFKDSVSHFNRSQPSASTATEPEESSVDAELQEIERLIDNDQTEESCTQVVRKYPNLISPSGPLRKKSSSFLYTSLFRMAWGGSEDKARSIMKYFRLNSSFPVDVKIISMEVVHTVNAERDLKVLTSALAYTDRPTCENKTILKCRLHRRIAGLHYRNNDLEEANEHMDTALQLAHNITPDIDTIYTMRLKALMLFEDYKRTRSSEANRSANKFFTRAMDHVRQQPESKRVITERVKVSKALFHLDMLEEYRVQEKGDDTLMELECRAQETLRDVEEEYLTEGDKAFFYLTKAKLLVCEQNWQDAKTEAQKALDLNKKCKLDKRAREAKELLAHIPTHTHIPS
jgi:tetratricopeptide (TPR) repeat protein